ncbi:MAG TPA: sulfatase-like hydrolase/transferase [Pilimelia sp.]|nr:sulfatase-like hydrolase/transferase [Pilimelia sp.]
MRVRSLFAAVVLALLPVVVPVPGGAAAAAAVATKPNIFFYNMDDLRDAVPGNIDPMAFMPKTQQWMAAGRRFPQHFVTEPSCCPSRASLMTGRMPHNNGVRLQSQGPAFDYPHSMACYLRSAGYSTYLAGKFLTSWPRTTTPPCFDHSTVMWGGYFDVAIRVDGVARTLAGYSTTGLGVRGREYITSALGLGKPFLLYEAPQAPHWVNVTNPDGTTTQRAIPEARYATAPVPTCSAPVETNRSDKPPYVRWQNRTPAQGQEMCASQLRAIMTADDQFDLTMRLLSDRGVLANTLVILSSDNGYMWSDHGRTEKFVPYEPSVRTPLFLRWDGQIPAGSATGRLASYVDVLPTILAAAQFTLPVGAPPLDGESLLTASRRTTTYAEYFIDSANGKVPTWRMIRTATVKYVHTYSDTGAVSFREYYNLTADPLENTNLLNDGTAANDPPAAELSALASRLSALSTCRGAACVV